MVITKKNVVNLDAGDIARYQGRLILISEVRPEYGRLAHSMFDVIYLENGAGDIANWLDVDPVGDITSDELASIMRVFLHNMKLADAIANVFAFKAMRESEGDHVA